MWSVQKVILWPQACNILQVGRAQRAKTPIQRLLTSLRPEADWLMDGQKRYFLLSHHFLLSYSVAVLILLFSAVSHLDLFIVFMQNIILVSLHLYSMLINYSECMMLPFLWVYCSLIPLFCLFVIVAFLSTVFPFDHIAAEHCVTLL